VQSTLTKVTRVQIKAERKKVMDAVRRDGGGGYVTDGRKWFVKTYLHEHEGDQDILLEGEGRISMKQIKEALSNRGEFDVWIEGQVDWHKNLKDYIDGNTDWQCGDFTNWWTVQLATQAEQ
jgi:hypothetical protein